ncbi:MAG: methionine--tRNA ligase [Nitrososphaeria archaeon]
MARWIVCSAWPYANSIPHLGTFMHLLSADVYARYLRMRGEEVIAVSGSDEHGTPIEVEALRRGIDPRSITDANHSAILRLLREYSVGELYYTRTESPVHREFVAEFYRRVEDNGYVFREEVEMPFCPRDGIFLPDRFVVGTCPFCGYENAKGDQCDRCGKLLEPTMLIGPRCAICGSTPEIRRTVHWYFDLPRFAGRLREYISSNDRLPDNARNASLRMIDEGLRPRALTRDNRWGIPAPFRGAEGKTIYVWMEAVLGYLSAVKELGMLRGDPGLFDRFWRTPGSRPVCFIGKDNVPFHTIIFPALLMASGDGYVLPWQVSSTEYVTFGGEKFSKSAGIGVWMDRALNVADGETWRFVAMYMRPESRDVSFSWEEFARVVNSELNDNLGNYVHRVLTLARRRYGPERPSCGGARPGPMSAAASATLARYASDMDSFRIRDGARRILELSAAGNERLSSDRPWELMRSPGPDLDASLCDHLAALDALAIMSYPFMPSRAEELWRSLGRAGSPADSRLSPPALPRGPLGEPRPLFRKVPESPEELQGLYEGRSEGKG